MISEIPPDERPRERLAAVGADALTLRECLALLLGSGPPGIGCLGLASRILDRLAPGLEGDERIRAFFAALEASDPSFLRAIPGVGPGGASRLLALASLSRRRMAMGKGNRSGSNGPAGILSAIPAALSASAREWIGFVPCVAKDSWGSLCVIEKGVRTHVNFDPAELFSRVLALRPRAIALVHNHPSGTLEPSTQDYLLTEAVGRISAALGIELVGHWIVTATGSTKID